MKPKMADSINIFMCKHCSAVHIGMWRNGKMFAEAIPMQPDALVTDLVEAVEYSRRLQAGGAPAGHKH